MSLKMPYLQPEIRIKVSSTVATIPNVTVLTIPEQLEALLLIFLTLGSKSGK